MLAAFFAIACGVVGSVLAALVMIYLEKKGILDRCLRRMVWPPYYYDSSILPEAVKDADNKFYVITGDGSFIDADWAKDTITSLVKKSTGSKINILFTNDIRLPDVRKKIWHLLSKSRYFNIHILENSELQHKLRATFSVNTTQYACLRVGKDKKKNEYIVKKYDEADLMALIAGYFDITPKVSHVSRKGDAIDITVYNGQEEWSV